MALITLLDGQLAFGHVPLLDHTTFSLETQERVGLIGRNGAGKSSMLKILGGLEKPDDGTLQVQGNTRIAYVAQEPQLDSDATVFVAVSAGLARVRDLIDEYSQGHGDLDAMQSEIESLDGWNWEQRVGETLHRLHLDADARHQHAVGRQQEARGLGAGAGGSRPTCCCSTSPPTTWTWTASSGWRGCCATSRAASSPSPTTARFWTTWRPASSSWTGASC